MKRAFTILEILVVIAIILVLLSLTFPAFTGAKGRAYETTCISNLKQVYSAAQMYMIDHDGPPPNSLLAEAWRPYLPLAIAHGCHAAAGNQDRYIAGDYALSFPSPTMDREMRECAERRGDEFPVAHDWWHLHTVFAASVGRKALLLVRSNGSAVSIPGKRIQQFYQDSRGFPCPDASAFVNM